MSAFIIQSGPVNVSITGGPPISGTGSPVGTVSVTGPSFYVDNSNPTSPVLWVKSTAGTSSSDWVIVGTFSNS